MPNIVESKTQLVYWVMSHWRKSWEEQYIFPHSSTIFTGAVLQARLPLSYHRRKPGLQHLLYWNFTCAENMLLFKQVIIQHSIYKLISIRPSLVIFQPTCDMYFISNRLQTDVQGKVVLIAVLSSHIRILQHSKITEPWTSSDACGNTLIILSFTCWMWTPSLFSLWLMTTTMFTTVTKS